ncbi:MAG: 8-amino-7-oxononanoate synthase [Alphaproteobacteria bacterium GM202ARS2]|nr:8-amino-7-oxononanoate synthase [Alphaproteobacteria bacterium GM202ARS2]
MKSDYRHLYADHLARLREQGLYRALQPRGQVINFASNDYLSLSTDDALRQATQRITAAGSGASRLLLGNHEAHEACEQVEATLAQYKGSETALLVASGWQTNVAVVASLLRRSLFVGKGDVAVFSDRLNHQSLHQGCQLAGVRQQRYRHLDMMHLESLLKKSRARYRYILSETLFSMDGDTVDVAMLVALARRYGAFLYLDDAHAMAVMGQKGFGLAAHIEGVDMVMSSFGKGMGCFGAAVTCSQELKAYLVNSCGGFIYSTALPPVLLAMMHASMKRVDELDARREQLLAQAERARTLLRQEGYDCLQSSSQIIPIMVSDEKVESVSRGLLAAGFYVPSIRVPTVPRGGSRLRLSLTSAVDEASMESFVATLKTVDPRKA